MKKEENDGMEMTPVLETGAVLMILGAVHAGRLMRLLCEATQCCLKRVRASAEDVSFCKGWSEEGTVMDVKMKRL